MSESSVKEPPATSDDQAEKPKQRTWAQGIESLLWVTLAALVFGLIASVLPLYMRGEVTMAAVSTRVGALSTLLALIALGLRMVGDAKQWDGNTWRNVLAAIECGGLMVAVVGLGVGTLAG